MDGYSSDCVITGNDVIAAVNKLKGNKGDGNKGYRPIMSRGRA